MKDADIRKFHAECLLLLKSKQGQQYNFINSDEQRDRVSRDERTLPVTH